MKAQTTNCAELRRRYDLPLPRHGIPPEILSEDDRSTFLTCPICQASLSPKWIFGYFPWRSICFNCDAEAVDADGKLAESGGLMAYPPDSPYSGMHFSYEGSANPVWVRGIKCFRRYKFGGHMTFLFDEEHRVEFTSPEFRREGCLLGLAVGDALGTTLEFNRPGSFEPITDMVGGGPFHLPPGAWTDDTSMALCLAESLIECNGFDPVDQLRRYLRWWHEGYTSSTGECFDIGNTTRSALIRFEATGEPYCGDTNPSTAGNGSLMRLAPIALFYAHNPSEAIERAADSSRTTHAAPSAVDACRYFCGLLVGALRGVSKEELLSPCYSPVAGYLEEHPLVAEIAEVAGGSFKRREPPEIRGEGYVVKTLEAALWAFDRTDSFREGVLKAVNLGDDADTVGAVYGQLAGAFYGFQEIPLDWRIKIAKRNVICDKATRLKR